MIKVEPVEFDNFTMSYISDEENNFDCIVAISTKDSDTIPLAEIRFESFNSINQQIGLYHIQFHWRLVYLIEL